jgi:glutamate-1-semialdehyde 2,1-aminomutase
VADEVLIAEFNNLASVAALVEARGHEIAAIIVEPLQRVLVPRSGFLKACARSRRNYGIVLIFDEVVTGFRIAWGGAQELYGVTPDLACYSKTIGGGYPVSAVVDPKTCSNSPFPFRTARSSATSGNAVR